MPWLTICSTPPCRPWVVRANVPRTMKPEVGDRRVRDQPLEVLLHRGDDRAVDDADDAEREEQRREVDRRLGEQVEAEAQEAVGAELQHDAGEDHRAGRRRLGVGVGQPGVEREQRHLDREGDGEAEEQPAAPSSCAIALVARRSSTRSKVRSPPVALLRAGHGQRHDRPSMNAEPSIVNRKNLMAA